MGSCARERALRVRACRPFRALTCMFSSCGQSGLTLVALSATVLGMTSNETRPKVRKSADMAEADRIAARVGVEIVWSGHGRRSGAVQSTTGVPFASTGAQRASWGFDIVVDGEVVVRRTRHATQREAASQAINQALLASGHAAVERGRVVYGEEAKRIMWEERS